MFTLSNIKSAVTLAIFGAKPIPILKPPFAIKILFLVGCGSIIIGDDIYKLSLKNYIFLIQKTSLRRYNKKTNQIFIENHNTELDSLILNFFKIDNLNKIKIDSDGVVTDFDSNLDINDFIIEFKFSEDSSSIKNLNISYNQYSLYLYDMVFLNERLDSKDLLSFKFPNAFTFDLRD